MGYNPRENRYNILSKNVEILLPVSCTTAFWSNMTSLFVFKTEAAEAFRKYEQNLTILCRSQAERNFLKIYGVSITAVQALI
jgi:hypothetical protein